MGVEDLFGATDDANSIQCSKKITVYIVGILLLILVLVFSHYLIIMCILIRRRSRRGAAINRLGLGLQLHQPPIGGLDPATIAALPVFVVEPKPQEEQGEDDYCAVCLSGFEEEEMAKLLPSCQHYFHVDCIDTWLGLQTTCPLCRAWVQPRLEPQRREGPINNSFDGASPMLFLQLLQQPEGTSESGGVGEAPPTFGGSGSQLRSFRMVLSHDDVHQDLERC